MLNENTLKENDEVICIKDLNRFIIKGKIYYIGKGLFKPFAVYINKNDTALVGRGYSLTEKAMEYFKLNTKKRNHLPYWMKE